MFLGQAIDSVLQQTMDDYEIIVVDDGSTDDTSERIMTYGENVRYFPTRNGGPAHARNIGMRMASGEYIAFLDSDDLYYPCKLEVHPEFFLWAASYGPPIIRRIAFAAMSRIKKCFH